MSFRGRGRGALVTDRYTLKRSTKYEKRLHSNSRATCHFAQRRISDIPRCKRNSDRPVFLWRNHTCARAPTTFLHRTPDFQGENPRTRASIDFLSRARSHDRKGARAGRKRRVRGYSLARGAQEETVRKKHIGPGEKLQPAILTARLAPAFLRGQTAFPQKRLRAEFLLPAPALRLAPAGKAPGPLRASAGPFGAGRRELPVPARERSARARAICRFRVRARAALVINGPCPASTFLIVSLRIS